MLAFILALLGGTVGLAGLSGGGSKANALTTPKSEASTPPPITAPKTDSPHMGEDEDDEDDMPMASGDMGGDDGGMPDMPMDHGDDDDDVPMDHGSHDDMPKDSGGAADMPMDHGDHTHTPKDDDTAADAPEDHGGHGSDLKLPVTAAEIDAFVTMVRSGEEAHVHDHGDDRMGEHMQVMDLVNPADATHIAIGHGSWFDPSNWHNGEVPGDDAKVVIPDGVYLEYDQQSDARLFTVRVDGQLDFATDVDSTMVVDTLIVAPGGVMTAGTEDDPVQSEVDVEIIIANNGAIDTNWDPGLFSRGIISHGKTEIHGARTDSHEKVVEDPMAGDISITFNGIPQGWEVGDKIVIAGTHYEGETWDGVARKMVRQEPEDEIRIISQIRGNEVFFEEPLEHDHDSPRADLKTSVANYSRNVTIKSEDGADSEIFARGHVMLMHSDDVEVSYAAFEELGRTDKSRDLEDADGFDSNVAGRYGLHLHRTGTGNENDPTLLTGNAVFGSPGWGIVHHDSHAHIVGNATYDTFGAGFVAESGNETGLWSDNIAIDAEGRGWTGLKNLNDKSTFDIGRSGDGFWFQGRMVASHDNIAASVNHGFAYFHRGDDGNAYYDATLFEFPDALNYSDTESAQTTPILAFSGNETFASRQGLQVVKANANQGHGIHSVLEGFTAWHVDTGAHFQYTSNYVLKDFDLIGSSDQGSGEGSFHAKEGGITFGNNVNDFTIVNPKIDGFYAGIEFEKNFSPNAGEATIADHDYTVVNPQITNVVKNYEDFNPVYDLIIESPGAQKPVTLTLDEPLYYDDTSRVVIIKGTKTDSLGTQDYPSAPDNVNLSRADVRDILKEDGYFLADDGHRYFTHKLYVSDSLTGDIYAKPIMVQIDDDVPFNVAGKYFEDAKFKGNVTLDQLETLVSQPAQQVHEAGRFEADGTIETASIEAHAVWQALTLDHGTYSDFDNESEHEEAAHHTHNHDMMVA